MANGCTAVSEILTVEIFENPTVNIQTPASVFCTDGTEELTLDAVVVGGVGPYDYIWGGPNDFFSADEDPTIFNIKASHSGFYTLVVTDANSCVSSPVSTQLNITNGISTQSEKQTQHR